MNEIGITKIMDGIFIADQSLVSDFQFLISNKVSHILYWGSDINAQIYQVQNIKVLHFQKNSNQDLLPSIQQLNKIYQFIEEAKQQCLCSLICSNIQSQAALIIVPYIMAKFSWDLKTILNFLNLRCSFFNPRVELVQQLIDFEINFKQISISNLKSIQFKFSILNIIETNDTDELILLNTIKNTLLENNSFTESKKNYSKRRKRVQWYDRLRPSSSLTAFNTTNKFIVYNRFSSTKMKKQPLIQEKTLLKTYEMPFKPQKKVQNIKRSSQIKKASNQNRGQFVLDQLQFQSLKQLSRTKIFKGSVKKRSSLRFIKSDKKQSKQNNRGHISSSKKLGSQLNNLKNVNFFTNVKIMSRVKFGQINLNA